MISATAATSGLVLSSRDTRSRGRRDPGRSRGAGQRMIGFDEADESDGLTNPRADDLTEGCRTRPSGLRSWRRPDRGVQQVAVPGAPYLLPRRRRHGRDPARAGGLAADRRASGQVRDLRAARCARCVRRAVPPGRGRRAHARRPVLHLARGHVPGTLLLRGPARGRRARRARAPAAGRQQHVRARRDAGRARRPSQHRGAAVQSVRASASRARSAS